MADFDCSEDPGLADDERDDLTPRFNKPRHSRPEAVADDDNVTTEDTTDAA